MKRLFFVILVLFGIMTSCTKNFEDSNTDKKRATAVPAENLFANAQKALADNEASTNVNTNIFKLFAQYWTETTYTDEANYDVANRGIANNMFAIYYRDVLRDLKEAKDVLEATEPIGDIAIAEQKNQLALIDITQVFAYSELVDIFGNVPYTEALDIDNIYPKYDDALTIYKDLLARLDADLASMDDTEGSFGDADLYFAGDVAMWKKFANSLKVRIGITIADGDDAAARTAIQSGYAGAFAPDEVAELPYLDLTNANPMYQDMIQSGRHDFIPANTIVDMMNAIEDPRRDVYFTKFNDVYIGGTYGTLSAFSQFSHVADVVQEPTYPSVLLDGIEISFYLAEAAERGYSVGKTAAEYYNDGITASFAKWGIADQAAAYLAKPEVAYATATGNWKQKIGTQAYFAYYVKGLVAWTSWRRLDFPILNVPPNVDGYSDIPVRFSYPAREATINGEQYTAAASAIGGDKLTTKLFWDKF